MEFSLAGDLNELETVQQQVARFCESNSLGGDVEFDLNLILEELFTNTLRHGGCKGLPTAARVELSRDAAGISVAFSDAGKEFNPLELPAPNLAVPLEQRAAGGMGVHLVKQVMHGLKYERVAGWNRLSMRR